jgi:hypothetical protein
MKLDLGRLVIRVFVALMIASLLPTAPALPVHGQAGEARWTVLIYSAADNNLESVMMRDINRLEMIGSTDDVNLVALIDRHPQYWTGSDNWSDTRLIRIEQDNNLFTITSPVIRRLGEANTGDPETLRRFIEWGVQSYPAEQYMLIIADHGGGWQGASSDESSDDQMISLAGLQRALEGGLRGAGLEQLDLLVFDTCLMGELEVWALLAPYARYGVASEEITYGLSGLNTTIGALVDDSDISPADLARLFVDNFAAYYADNKTFTTLTMSAVDLEQLPAVQRAVDRLAKALIADVNTPETILAAARGVAHSPAFADTDREFFGIIDLRSFLLILEYLSENPTVVKAAQQAQRALEEAVLARYGGPDVPSVGGLSFFFPTWSRLVDIYRNGYKDIIEPVPGADESAWIEFLTRYPDALKAEVEIPTIDDLRLASDTLAEGEVAEATATVGGIGLKEVQLIAGRVEGDALITVDANRIVLDEEEVEEGLGIPAWDPVSNPMTASWDGAGWVVSNGAQSVRTSIQAVAPGSDTFAVPGFIRSISGGREMDGEIQFAIDMETSEATFIGAFVRQPNGLLGAYTFEPGDAFAVKRQVINLTDGSVEEVRGGGLMVGQSPPELLPAPVPAGSYQFGIRAVNLADEGTTQLADLRVTREVEAAEYRSRSLSFVTQRPADWLVEETVGTVTFTPDEVSSVKAQVAVIPLARLGAAGRLSLEEMLPALVDILSADSAVGDVETGEVSPATLAGRDAQRLDYTYALAGRGTIAGSIVALLDAAREQLVVSLAEAPAGTLEDELPALDLVRDNLSLLPTMFVSRTYSNPTLGFSLRYNDYWQVIERPGTSDVFFRTSALDAALRIQERPGRRLPSKEDNDAQLAIYVEEWLKGESGLEVSDPSDVELSGLAGRRVDYVFEEDSGARIEGSVAAVTTRDGRAYLLNAEVDTTSVESDTLRADLDRMQASFTIVDPDASPVPNPGEGWLIYENPDLHFGLAYLDFLDVEEALDDPDFQVVRFTYGELMGIEVGLLPLTANTPPTADTADRLVSEFVATLGADHPDMQVGTLARMDLAGIPARGQSYGWVLDDVAGSDEPVEIEGTALVAPTPYGFAYLVNLYVPLFFTGDAPVDADVVPHLLGTFTPLLEGLKPVSQVASTGQRLRFYVNDRLGVRVTVPVSWRSVEESHGVTFSGTDEVGRPMAGYEVHIQNLGRADVLAVTEMDMKLGELISEALDAETAELRPMGNIGDPVDASLDDLAGRSVEFVALYRNAAVVKYRVILVQSESGQLYQVSVLVPVSVAEAQQETLARVLDSIEFTGE